MSKFGWDLPPGVTTRMIEDAYGGDPQAEAFEQAFFEQTQAMTDKLAEWCWKQMGEAYQKGYKQGMDDEAEANRLSTDKEGLEA